MTLFGHHIRRITVVLTTIETAIFCLVFLLFAETMLVDGGFGRPDLAQSVFMPVGMMLLCLMAIGSYDRSAWQNVPTMAWRLGLGAIASVACIILGRQLAPSAGGSLGMIAGPVLAGCFLAFLLRLAGRQLPSLRARLKPRTLVLGAGNQAADLWRALRQGAAAGCGLCGFVSYDHDHRSPSLPTGKVLALPGSLAAFVAAERIDEIVIARDASHRPLPEQELISCRLNGIAIFDAASFLERELGRINLDLLDPHWLIFSPGFRRALWRKRLKRLVDVLVSALAVSLLLPLLPLIALAIKLDSRGPVLYRQDRVGLNGQLFQIYKFRSMRADAEADGRARWAGSADHRVTRVGRLLRASRMDELPQFMNVLKGEMSLVGPRPERPEFTRELAREIRFFAERHCMRPGITGWAQINYHYGASVEDAKVKLEYDLYYIKNHSTFLDLLILFHTARIALSGFGAR